MKRLLVAGLATLALLVGCSDAGADDPPPGERMGKAVGEAVEKGQ